MMMSMWEWARQPRFLRLNQWVYESAVRIADRPVPGNLASLPELTEAVPRVAGK